LTGDGDSKIAYGRTANIVNRKGDCGCSNNNETASRWVGDT
jgi:hypothetical protein